MTCCAAEDRAQNAILGYHQSNARSKNADRLRPGYAADGFRVISNGETME
jgi:hypothetical protein